MKKLFAIVLACVMLLLLNPVFGCTPSETVQAGDKEIKNVILFIGDGMGPVHVEAGGIYAGETLSFERLFDNKTYADTDNVLGLLTDSAAAGTALATGIRTYNGYVGKDADGKEIKTIMDISSEYGKKTGIITTEVLSGATPGAFSAHAFDRNDTFSIIRTQASGSVDFLAGYHSDNYDKQTALFLNNGYTVMNDLQYVPGNDERLIFQSGIIKPEQQKDEFGSDMYFMLEDIVSYALDFLSCENGFTLMVEGAYIDKCSHSNDAEGMVKNAAALSRAVETAYNWAKERGDTLIIVTADHETGGLSLNGNAATDKFASGDFGGIEWSSTGHTRTRVPVYMWGAPYSFKDFSTSGSDDYILNTDVFRIMHAAVQGNKKVA